jgi:hypothetical protein
MFSLLPALVALVGTAIFASIAVRSRRAGRRAEVFVPVENADYAASAVRGVRLKIFVAVIAGLIVASAAGAAPIPQLHLGLGLAVAPGVGAIVGCLIISMSPLPRPVRAAGLRQAGLVPRRASSFGPAWGFLLPLASAAILVVFLIATAELSSTDYLGGLSREIGQQTPGGYQAAGPYPGWFYVLPLLAMTGLLSLSVLLALRRISGARSLGTPGLDDFDRSIRRSLTRFVMLLSSSVSVLYLGATAFAAGAAARSVSQWAKPSAQFIKRVGPVAANGADPTFQSNPADFIHGVVQPAYTAAAIETTLGVVLIGFALTLFFLAISSVRIRWSTATPALADHRERVLQ